MGTKLSRETNSFTHILITLSFYPDKDNSTFQFFMLKLDEKLKQLLKKISLQIKSKLSLLLIAQRKFPIWSLNSSLHIYFDQLYMDINALRHPSLCFADKSTSPLIFSSQDDGRLNDTRLSATERFSLLGSMATNLTFFTGLYVPQTDFYEF